ncbi:MAG: exodeoxyribonuclease V subunit gamma [Deltaproteobacteria bacterium]|nr:exodeoxyribonuclease V subunit gamma [Deltaproteobacteria bacterium]
MPLTVHRSNRTEVLAAHLARVMRGPLRSALTPELLVVEGRGLERWLSQQVVRANGIWANVEVLLPRAMVERVLDLAAGDGGDRSIACYEPEVTLWAVADLLAGLLDRPSFAPLRAYLEGSRPGSPRWLELSERLARTLDDYAVYRPAWVRRWEQGQGIAPHPDEHAWQPELWRALVGRLGPFHAARRAQDFFAAVRRGTLDVDKLPQRLHLFGLTSLAPLYLHLLVAMAEHSDLHLYVLSPSEAFWSDIQSRLPGHLREWRAGQAEADLHLTLGHPLLASLGRQGRDLQRLLESLPDPDEQDDYGATGYASGLVDRGEDGAGSPDRPMLLLLQDDMRRLQVRAAAESVSATEQRVEPLPLRLDDRSISIHSCHSALRELEVLRDELLTLFGEDQTLAPADVAVLMPDLDRYAPVVDAVFGAPEVARRLSYTVADRGARQSLDLVEGLLRLIELGRGRLEAPAVLDLLANPALRRRHDLHPDDLLRIEGWVAEAGIRWGVDAAHRKSLGHPDLEDNTWRFGLDRLLLGFAMPGQERSLFGGVLPHDDVEGSDGATLGKLLQLCERLFALQRELVRPRPVAAWVVLLEQTLGDFFAGDDEHDAEAELVQRALGELVRRAEQGGYAGDVEIDALVTQLEAQLERGRPAQGFLRGAVTFCGTVPMRAIPFRVLALVGMNDDSFPRQDRRPGFDLMAKKPLPGDRSRREDDRYLFLEALLSARERLIITYTGRGISDNAVRPPSVVVSELLDALCDSRYLPGLQHAGKPVAPGSQRMKSALRRLLVQEHPLQCFSPRNFLSGERAKKKQRAAVPARPLPRSHDAAACRGAQALQRAAQARPAFVDRPLPDEAQGDLPLADLLRFYRDPVAWFFRRRLGLDLEEGGAALEPDEPIELTGLSRWQVGDRLLRHALERADPQTARRALRASGRLPLGAVGDCEIEQIEETAQRIASAAAPALDGAAADVEVDWRTGAIRIVGTLRQVRPNGLVQVSYSRDSGPHELRAWLQHLLLCAHRPQGVALRSTLIFSGAKPGQPPAIVSLRQVDDPAAELASLVELYRLGCRLPLPLLPRTSWTFACWLLGGKTGDLDYAVDKARQIFEGESGGGAERDLPQVRQAFDHCDPLRESFCVDGDELSFVGLAERVYGPLFRHREGA